jgi:septum formation protein
MATLPSEVILASQSPRRKELLAQIGIRAIVRPADIDEMAIRDSDPDRLARSLASAKATTVRERLAGSGDEDSGDQPPVSGLPVIAADTVVALDHHILEKPDDVHDARRMMGILSGRTHEVITGIAVILPGSPSPDPIVHSAVSRITLSLIAEPELDEYLECDEWNGVAGAYRIQGIAARYVEHLEGSYSNVVGLPLHLVYAILTGQLT